MIKAFTGRYGTGKTTAMVEEAYHWLPKKIKIITNTPFSYRYFKFYSLRNMIKSHSLGENASIDARVVTKLTDYFDLFKTETDTIFVLDEAGTWLDSYQWEKVDEDIYARFQQTRKVNIHLLYTCQFFNFVVKKLRQITDVVVKCEAPIRKRPNKAIPYDKGTPVLIRKIDYNPEMFELKGIPTMEQEQKYIERRSFIFGYELEHAFNSFDTNKIISKT